MLPVISFWKSKWCLETKITHVPKVTGYVLICAHGMMFRKVKCDYNFQNLPSSFLKLLCIDVTYSPAGVLFHSEAARSWLWFSTDTSSFPITSTFPAFPGLSGHHHSTCNFNEVIFVFIIPQWVVRSTYLSLSVSTVWHTSSRGCDTVAVVARLG